MELDGLCPIPVLDRAFHRELVVRFKRTLWHAVRERSMGGVATS
jgi:hypothetical protein